MDGLNGIGVFVQVAELRSFVAAGRALGISASAVGKSIARLEDRLGVRLFHRSTRSVTLTAEGGLFLERCRRILAEVEAAGQELSQAATTPRGRLRVSLPQVSPLMLPVLGDFMRHYPEVALDLDFTDRLVDVIEEGFDAVIRTGEPADSRLTARRLGRFKRYLVASPGYLARHGRPERPEDLAAHICLHYRFPSSGKLEQWPFQRAADAPDLQLPISMTCNNMETRVCFALRDLGVAWLPEFAIRPHLASGALVPILADHLDSEGLFYILWPASKHPSPKVRALVDFLSAQLFAPEGAG
ncbi:LysR family transcriptional regulator [Xinfangfangia sp. D13-10-4-6]|uniref:LysR family transcriptional regulator n=1 Tax=Pseudogemmobacter hezensis TaxID=2737662 RepID=UPI00155505B4|nr:LysR family transcriptional regulator [Pseudogemmobacter hezensis]NPD17035.1 LysR family transcriptional regulator [Pseudogemmobacter hezensis]